MCGVCSDDDGGMFHKPGDADDSDSDSDVEEKIKKAAFQPNASSSPPSSSAASASSSSSAASASSSASGAAGGSAGAGGSRGDHKEHSTSSASGSGGGERADGAVGSGELLLSPSKKNNLWASEAFGGGEHSRNPSAISLAGISTNSLNSSSGGGGSAVMSGGGRKKTSMYTSYSARALICYLHLKIRIPKKRQLTFRLESDKLRNAWIRGLLASGVVLSQWESEENEREKDGAAMFG
jgi:hypothetical protein